MHERVPAVPPAHRRRPTSNRHSTAPPTGIAAAEQPRREHSRVVDDEQVTGAQVSGKPRDRAVLDASARALEDHEPRRPARRRRLRDEFVGQIEVEVSETSTGRGLLTTAGSPEARGHAATTAWRATTTRTRQTVPARTRAEADPGAAVGPRSDRRGDPSSSRRRSARSSCSQFAEPVLIPVVVAVLISYVLGPAVDLDAAAPHPARPRCVPRPRAALWRNRLRRLHAHGRGDGDRRQRARLPRGGWRRAGCESSRPAPRRARERCRRPRRRSRRPPSVHRPADRRARCHARAGRRNRPSRHATTCGLAGWASSASSGSSPWCSSSSTSCSSPAISTNGSS